MWQIRKNQHIKKSAFSKGWKQVKVNQRAIVLRLIYMVIMRHSLYTAKITELKTIMILDQFCS